MPWWGEEWDHRIGSAADRSAGLFDFSTISPTCPSIVGLLCQVSFVRIPESESSLSALSSCSMNERLGPTVLCSNSKSLPSKVYRLLTKIPVTPLHPCVKSKNSEQTAKEWFDKLHFNSEHSILISANNSISKIVSGIIFMQSDLLGLLMDCLVGSRVQGGPKKCNIAIFS